MLNPLGDKKGCNVFLFCLSCLPGYLLPSYYTCCFLGHRMMGMIFIRHGGEREARAMETEKRNGRHGGRWKSMRKSWTLSRREQRNTTQIHSKPAPSGSVWNNLFKNQSISGGCHLCALLECQLWLISSSMGHVFTSSTVVKTSGKAAHPVRVCNNAGGLACYWILFHK